MSKQLNRKDEIIGYAVEMHRTSGADPRSFLALCDTFKSVLALKLSSKGSQQEHLKKGLEKLLEANDLVDKLTSEA